MLTGFFKEAPPSLWPRAVVIEHLSRNEWQADCLADMLSRGYVETGKTRSNTLLLKVTQERCPTFMSAAGNIAASLPLSLPEP